MPLARKLPAGPRFSLDPSTIGDILTHARPLGHHEDRATLNLGFGFLYYGLVRALRPRHVVVIGSGFGFSVICLALALRDNARGGLTFVDPSFSMLRNGPFHTVGGTSQWDRPDRVHSHFARFGVADVVTHHKLKSADFFARYEALDLPPIDLGFIDGNHSYADVASDFGNVLQHAPRNAYILMHDTNLYMRELVRHAGVKRWLRRLARRPDEFELVDFPFSSGLGVVRVLRGHEASSQAA